MRPDCPDELKELRDILDKAYGYNKGGQVAADEIDDLEEDPVTVLPQTGKKLGDSGDKLLSTPPPLELTRAAGTSNIRCYSQVVAPRGFYNTPTAVARGNCFIAYKPDGDPRADWAAGQIQYIFLLGERKKLAIRRSKGIVLASDPFARYYEFGFKAKLLSCTFSDELEVIDVDWVVGHTARWEFSEGFAAVLNLARVGVA